MGKRIDIAIIDSGIDKTHHRMKSINFIESKNFTGSNKLVLYEGHGTNICDRIRSVIVKHGCLDDFGFYDLQVFEQKSYVVEHPIIEAIKYCIKKKVSIINISLGVGGTVVPPAELYDVCHEAYKNGILIVAAADNYGNVCYPADFKFVCGVSAGIIEKSLVFGYDPDKDHIIGKGDFQRMADLDNKYVFKPGTSYATGHITGLLALYISKYGLKQDVCETIEEFKQGKTENIRIINSQTSRKAFSNINVLPQKQIDSILRDYYSEDKFSWVGKVAIYPFSNKEFGSIKHSYEQFRFPIAEIFDFPRSLFTQKKILLGNKEYNLKFNISNIENDFDTLILGYPEDIASPINIKCYNDLLKYCLSNNKNLFCFDQKIVVEIKKHTLYTNYTGKIYCPVITPKIGDNYRSIIGLGKVKKPVLAIVGTSSRCGKFSAQLKIKRILTEEGYSVGWLSTEPQGELFGAHAPFPYGFSSTVYENSDYWITLLSGMVKGIEISKKTDIIITGHQSGLISPSIKQDTHTTLYNFSFLYGTQPDAVMCTVSVYDSIDYVEKTLNLLKYYFETPIICLILSEIKREYYKDNSNGHNVIESFTTTKEWEEHAKILEKTFNIPVVNTFDRTFNQKILAYIENFF